MDELQEQVKIGLIMRAISAMSWRKRSSQKRQKEIYDRRVTGGRFSKGGRVWLHSPAVPRGKSPKFHKPWKGPFTVVKVLSDVTY